MWRVEGGGFHAVLIALRVVCLVAAAACVEYICYVDQSGG